MARRLVLHDAFSVLRKSLETEGGSFSVSNIVQRSAYSQDLEFWVFDGPRNTEVRRNIYPAYKANRKPAREDIYQGLQFTKELMKIMGLTVIEVPGYEADDAIATITKKYAGKLPIYIDTIDYDLRALCSAHPTVTCRVPAKEDVPDHLIQLYKLWVGDPSDNIPGIHRFGHMGWVAADTLEILEITAAVFSGKPLPPSASLPKRVPTWIDQNRDEWMKMAKCLQFQTVPDDILNEHTTKREAQPDLFLQLVREYEG